MIQAGLAESASPVGKRDSNTEMGTDDERGHEFFYLMTFADKAKCDQAYDYIDNAPEEARIIHHDVVSKITDNIHICWADVSI